MNNRINELRQLIRALRVSMQEAEAIMHAQIGRDEDCSFVAQEVLKMRHVMSLLVQERSVLGDNEAIVVQHHFVPRRPSTALRLRGAKPGFVPQREIRTPAAT